MRKIEWSTLAVVMVWVIVLLLAALSYHPSEAQDNTITSCYTRTDAGMVFTFSNIPEYWLNELGWYYIGDDAALKDHTLTVTGLQFDEGYSYAIVGAGDYSDNVTATTEITAECELSPTPETTVEYQAPIVQQPISQIVVSTGRTCVIKYPEIILVCNG